ncbi:hypothetical protein M2161_000734 [Streptomyces sp. SAI-133]|nr:hypothetical protein [Streptomyces sp. SAI-041]MDH6581628.1 hypothetical protein [Streptomyces sp. SAI-133]
MDAIVLAPVATVLLPGRSDGRLADKRASFLRKSQ